MNPWYERLVEDCMAEHDRVCVDGAECKQREVHTESAYIAPALRHRLAALQGQVARAEARIKAARDVHRHITVETRGAIEPEHRCLDCCLAWPCPTIRALDGEQ